MVCLLEKEKLMLVCVTPVGNPRLYLIAHSNRQADPEIDRFNHNQTHKPSQRVWQKMRYLRRQKVANGKVSPSKMHRTLIGEICAAIITLPSYKL